MKLDPRTWDVKAGALWTLVVAVAGGFGLGIDWVFKMGEKIDATPTAAVVDTLRMNDSLLDLRVRRLERGAKITSRRIRILSPARREGWIRRKLRELF